MSSLPRMKPILPWWQLAALLALGGAGIYFLVPGDPQLLETLVRDRNTVEARRLLDRIPPAQRARDPDRFRLLELRLARQELPPGDAAALAAFWSRAADTWRESHFADAIFLEFASFVPQLRDPAAAWSRVSPHFEAAPSNQRLRLADTFVRTALAAGQPATAAAAFAAARPPAERTTDDLIELSRLWQLAGRTDEALAALGDRPVPRLLDRRVALLRELNRNAEALAALLAHPKSAAPAPDRLERIAEVAGQAAAPAAAVPVFERHLAAHPDDLAAARRLRQLLVASGEPARAAAPARRAVELGRRQPEDIRELARILEWSGDAAAAFDSWLELSRTGDLPAVERLVALNPGLYRDADLAAALARVVDTPAGARYTLKLGRLYSTLGQYDDARRQFERHLAAAPDDFEAVVELARMNRELYDFAAAARGYRRAHELRPHEEYPRRGLAEALVLDGQFETALDVYVELARTTDDDEVLDPLFRLAESLGRYDSMVLAFRAKLERTESPVPRDYELLAYAYELTGRAELRRDVLADGLRRFPGHNALRLQLAFVLAAERRFPEAQRTLAVHARLADDPIVATLYLEMMRANDDRVAERAYLSLPLAPAVRDDESVLDHLADAHEALGDLAVAERMRRDLLARRPSDFSHLASLASLLSAQGRYAEARALIGPLLARPNPPVLRLAAEVFAAAGDPRAAERYQLAYLAAVRSAGATEWGALGDIRLSRGDRAGAKRAYAEGLRRLHATLADKGSRR